MLLSGYRREGALLVAVDDLLDQYIASDPHGPDEARVKTNGVPVWAIIGYWRVVNRDVERVAADYEVPAKAVEAALAYYNRNTAVIDARLALNAA
jgi:uncharacterized protein (DUF433 family)